MGFDFCFCPDEKLAFLAFAVGVLRAVKPALGRSHFAKHVFQYFASDIRKAFFARGLIGFQIRGNQQGVVVKHFFKVRNQPTGIGGIAMKAIA